LLVFNLASLVGWHLAVTANHSSKCALGELAAVFHINKSNAAVNNKRLYTLALDKQTNAHIECSFSLSLEEIQRILMTGVLLVRNLLLFIPMILRNMQLEVNCSNSLILSYVSTKKQGDEVHETFMHRLIQEINLISLFPNILILRIYLCLMSSNSSGERSFSKLKLING